MGPKYNIPIFPLCSWEISDANQMLLQRKQCQGPNGVRYILVFFLHQVSMVPTCYRLRTSQCCYWATWPLLHCSLGPGSRCPACKLKARITRGSDVICWKLWNFPAVCGDKNPNLRDLSEEFTKWDKHVGNYWMSVEFEGNGWKIGECTCAFNSLGFAHVHSTHLDLAHAHSTHLDLAHAH